MRNLSVLFGVLLVMGGVFGADEVKDISANVGDDVILETDDADADAEAEVKRADDLSWRIQGEKGFIAQLDRETNTVSINTKDKRFSGRVLMDNQTGSLTIKNISTADSRVYELEISSKSVIKTKTFSLTVHGVFGADEVKPISAKVGEDVILETDDAEVQGANELLWRIRGENHFIARYREANKVSINPDDKRFSGRLQMDERTGSLTIKNINTADSRVYELRISSKSVIKKKTFNLTVDDDVVVVEVTVMEGDSVTLNINDTEVQKDEELNWMVSKNENDYKSINDARFKKGETGSLTITNINSKDGGLYRLKSISSTSSDVKNKARFNVTVHEGLKSVSVMEGDTITLHTGVTQILTDRLNSTGASRSNINLNEETGEITITNIRGDQSGEFEVEINTSTVTLHRKISINISGVFSDEKDGVKTVTEKTGNSVVLHTRLTKIQNNDISIEWTFGPQNISIAKHEGKSINIIYNEHNHERFKNGLTLQTDSGDLTIKNANSEHSGLYQIKIINNTHTIQKRFSVTVSDSDSSAAVSGVCGVSFGLLVWAVTVLFLQEI